MTSSRPRIVAIVPARWSSTRLPGKPLTDIRGLPLVERVRRQALNAKLVDEVIVATDDQRIFDTVRNFGGLVQMTRTDHLSGTDRIAEVVTARPDIDIAVNVQGDEPLIDPQAIDDAIKPLIEDLSIGMSTIACPISDFAAAQNPNIVKVVTDKMDFALYFSRAAIPFRRSETSEYLHHAGLYVYRRQCLLELALLEPTPLELAESLEQLRAIENGIRIKVVKTNYRPQEVNVPADIDTVESILQGYLRQPANFPL